MVLERIGDGESKNLLKRWAGGPAGARLTMEAAAALKRLEAMSKATKIDVCAFTWMIAVCNGA